MKGWASEFTWWVPDAGFSLASAMAPRPRGPKYLPWSVHLQAAARADEGAPVVSAEDANQGLINYLGVGPRPPRDIHADGRSAYEWPSVSCPGRWYTPLVEYTGLFLSFAKATADAEGFMRFANRYGRLYKGCSLLAWYAELLAMQQAVRVWELLCAEDERTLAELFKWRTEETADAKQGAELFLEYDSHPKGRPSPTFPDRRVVTLVRFIDLLQPAWSRLDPEGEAVVSPFSPCGEFGDVAADREEAAIWHGLAIRQKPDALLAARLYLEHVISVRLSLHTIRTFDVADDEGISRSRKGRPRLKRRVQIPRVAFPQNLLGAIWVQFEGALREGKEYRVCAACGKDFEVGPGVARGDKEHCSDPCRSKAFRENVKRAKAMRAAGKSVKQIARKLGAEEKSVEKWLSGNRKGD